MKTEEFIKHVNTPSSINDMLYREKEHQCRKKFFWKTSVDGKTVTVFSKKTKKLVNVLRYRSYPDNYYDTNRKKVVCWENSGIVRCIIQERLERSEISLEDWKGKKKKCNIKKKGRKPRPCWTKLVAVPKKGKIMLVYTPEYVYEHPDKFDYYNKCRVFDLDYPKRFDTIYVPVTKLQLNTNARNEYIKALRERGIPRTTLQYMFNLKARQMQSILKGVKVKKPKEITLGEAGGKPA